MVKYTQQCDRRKGKGYAEKQKNLLVRKVGGVNVRGNLRCCLACLLCEEGCGQLMEGLVATLLTPGYLDGLIKLGVASDVACLLKKKSVFNSRGMSAPLGPSSSSSKFASHVG